MADLAGHVVVVDLNRQSLDRVVGDHRSRQLERLFRALGWHVVSLRFGRRLGQLFAEPGGGWLRERLETHGRTSSTTRSSAYPPAAARKALGEGAPPETAARLEALGDAEVAGLLADLGGHDLDAIVDAFAEADAVSDRPVAILAWTLKGWRLPFAGDPLNHGAQLTGEQLAALRRELGVPEGDEWAPFPPDSAEGAVHAPRDGARASACPRRYAPPPPAPVPDRLDLPPRPATSTQEAFGDVLAALGREPGLESRAGHRLRRRGHHDAPVGLGEPAGRVRDPRARRRLRAPRAPRRSSAGRSPRPASTSSWGSARRRSSSSCPSWAWRPSCPAGGSCRSARSTTASCRAGSTPCCTPPTRRRASSSSPARPASRLAPEGGAHQSVVTPALGIEVPNLRAYEPTFAREVEWLLLEALRRDPGSASTARRCTCGSRPRPSTRRCSQPALDRLGEATLRAQVLRGGYRLVDRAAEPGYEPGANVVTLVAAGVMVPEAVEASQQLAAEGIHANVVALDEPARLLRGMAAQVDGLVRGDGAAPAPRGSDELFPADDLEGEVPVVTVLDGHSHALGVARARVLGVPHVPARRRRLRPVGRPLRPLPALRDRRGRDRPGRPPPPRVAARGPRRARVTLDRLRAPGL